MKTGDGMSKPVLAFVLAGVVLTVLLLWFGLRHRDNQPPGAIAQPEAPSQSQSEAPPPPPATLPVTSPETFFEVWPPPVIPIPLTNLIVAAENTLWLKDKTWLTYPRGTQI